MTVKHDRPVTKKKKKIGEREGAFCKLDIIFGCLTLSSRQTKNKKNITDD